MKKKQKKQFLRRIDSALISRVSEYRRKLSAAEGRDLSLDEVTEHLLRDGLSQNKKCLNTN